MAEKNIICGIDVGTTKIVAIIAEYDENEDFSIIGIGESKSYGLDRGVIVNVKDTIKSLGSAIEQAQNQSKHTVESVFVGISGDHIMGFNGTGVVTVGDTDSNSIGGVIDRDDKDRVLKSAQAINLSSERRILHVLSKSFKVNETAGIEDPEGLTGNRLEAEVHIVTSSKQTENDFKTCFDELNIDIEAFVLEPVASSYSILSNDEKKFGAVMIDIGGGTTDVVTWDDGGITDTIIIPYGGEIITRDIAQGLRCQIEHAEMLKLQYGSALEALSEDEIIIVNAIEGQQEIDSRKLSSIIEARVREILNNVKFEIEKKTQINNLTFGIVLTGGGSELRNIIETCENIFQTTVRIGKPRSSGSLSSIEDYIFSPKYATGIGIIQYAVKNRSDLYQLNHPGKSFLKTFITNIKELFTN